ncbi:MAG: uroporphyrinogen-III C-methyltransferase [Rhodospirillaceae bacterium]|nr:MAG: uroporphyrinogen-III C-methyltransferase [Rhodospirillaceae bacterium]
MERLTFEMPQLEPGWVWLTGAGPGDPGLLTLHALNGIRQADVIVHDALVSDETLAQSGPDCEIVYAGKRGGKPSPKQPDISARLIKLARDGKKVLRLKGGDPFIFGRGSEEALALVAAGVPFRVIPGISAGVGGLARAGIPLTHRETNSTVTFITGHGASGDIPDGIDWPALAAGSPVLVIYMAIKHLAIIRQRLFDGGRHRNEAVAVVSNATLAEEVVLETTLGRCVEDVARSDIEPPAMVVVGEVVRLRDGLDWAGALGGKLLAADPLGTRSAREAG